VFVVRDGSVETPPLSAGCLPGITRAQVLRLSAGLGIEAAESDQPGSVLTSSDELFLTSSTREVQPLVAVNGQRVGAGRPGPVTLRLKEAFQAMVAAPH
jgi:branched-subunit amino acid aminotransferase/4-amino-4-deoxychorismate lyase